MGRPIYPYELSDPDFAWLISNFQESHPQFLLVESDCLPIVFVESSQTPILNRDLPMLPGRKELPGPEESNKD